MHWLKLWYVYYMHMDIKCVSNSFTSRSSKMNWIERLTAIFRILFLIFIFRFSSLFICPIVFVDFIETIKFMNWDKPWHTSSLINVSLFSIGRSVGRSIGLTFNNDFVFRVWAILTTTLSSEIKGVDYDGVFHHMSALLICIYSYKRYGIISENGFIIIFHLLALILTPDNHFANPYVFTLVCEFLIAAKFG